MSGPSTCNVCLASRTGICINNQTCECLAGYAGVTCQNTVNPSSSSQINAGAIVAGVLGGVLLAVIVGLAIFLIWKKKRGKKKFSTLSTTSSIATTIPSSESIVVPALYNIALSEQYSNETALSTVSYHIYDELS